MTAVTKVFLSDAEWQRANAAYFDHHLQRLRLLLHRRALWLRSRWTCEERRHRDLDSLEGMVIRDETADRLFQPAVVEETLAFYRENRPALDLGQEIDQAESDLVSRSQALAAV